MTSISCPYCNGKQVETDILVSDGYGILQGLSNSDRVGLYWKTDDFLATTSHQIEPLMADLCVTCGTVVRLRIRNLNRKWVKAP